jgi:hypothetical protein
VSFVACTVATRRYLAFARVAADSFFEHHPDGRFAVLVPDDPRRERTVGDPRVEELRLADIGIEEAEQHRLVMMYGPQELAVAMKARLAQFLVARGDVVVALDGDVCVYGDLTPLAELASRDGLVLTPHNVSPHATPEHYPPQVGWASRVANAFGPEQMSVLAGTWNAGVMGLAAGAEDFLEWWNARLARYSRLEPVRGLFLEQGWLTLAPMLFESRTLREESWNVNGFALHRGDVEWQGAQPFFGGEPVRCFHFITFDPLVPGELSRDPHIRAVFPALSDRPGVARACREYAARVLAAGHAEMQADVSPFERLDDGTAVDANMRVAYANALISFEAGREGEGEGEAPPNPFSDGDHAGFLEWLAESVPEGDGGGGRGGGAGPPVSRYLVGLHTRLNWVYGLFKHVPGEDAERFLVWLPEAVDRGEIDVPERWLPPRAAPGTSADPAVAVLQRQYRELAQALDTHRRSVSWRITAPLRAAGSLFRRARRRRHADGEGTNDAG